MSRKRKIVHVTYENITKYVFASPSLQTENNSSKPSDSKSFPLQSVIRYVLKNVSVCMFDEKIVESRHKFLAI